MSNTAHSPHITPHAQRAHARLDHLAHKVCAPFEAPSRVTRHSRANAKKAAPYNKEARRLINKARADAHDIITQAHKQANKILADAKECRDKVLAGARRRAEKQDKSRMSRHATIMKLDSSLRRRHSTLVRRTSVIEATMDAFEKKATWYDDDDDDYEHKTTTGIAALAKQAVETAEETNRLHCLAVDHERETSKCLKNWLATVPPSTDPKLVQRLEAAIDMYDKLNAETLAMLRDAGRCDYVKIE